MENNQIIKTIISLDVGKYDTKATGKKLIEGSDEEQKLKKVYFRTKEHNLKDGFIDLEGNSYKVEFNGEEYIIGEQGENKSYDTSKTNLLHKLAAYTAITEYIEENTSNNKVYIVLACPLSVLKYQDTKEEYKKFIKGEGEVKIKVNGKNYSFTIEDITIKAEGSGIVFLEKEKFRDSNVAVIDLGGLNMGFSLYRNGVCKNDDRFIEECGANILTELVREELTKYKNGNLVSYDQAEQALKKGFLPKAGKSDAESAKAIDFAKERYFNKVMDYVKAHGFKLDELDKVIFVGGTSQNISSVINTELNHSYIPEDSQWCTCDGCYKIALKKYGK